MKVFRYILFPIAIIYGGITLFRNFLYNKNIFKSSEFDLPIICIGNLSMGGTGKTPLSIEIYSILKNHWTTARDNTIFKNTRSNQNKRYENFGEKILSPREIEVAKLIFEGHSGNSIAANLDIAITTVKSHRKNMYKKLGIGSQQELFSRYIDSISR